MSQICGQCSKEQHNMRSYKWRHATHATFGISAILPESPHSHGWRYIKKNNLKNTKSARK